MAMIARSGEHVGDQSVELVCRRMFRRLRSGHGGAALQGLSQFVAEIISRQSSVARVFSSRELDHACLAIGQRLREVPTLDETRERTDCIVFLVSHLALTGGHSRVLGDLVEAEPAEEHRILASNLFDNLTAAEVSDLFQSQGLSLEIASDKDFAARVRWLQRRLAEIRPRKTYMLLHHSDSISVAAAQRDLVGELVYFHNCDHSLALGVHIPHALHVDFNAKGFYNCREREGVPANVVWPIVVRDQGHRANRPFLVRGHLTTCSCGGSEKLLFGRYKDDVSYAYRYEKLIPYVLRASGGTHIHIGTLPPPMLSAIDRGMKELGIARDRFINIDYVPSLWRALLDLNVDVYVASFPLGGGRAAIEAMGAGLPLVVHRNYRSIFFTDINDVYPGAVSWDRPEALFTALTRFNHESLREHALKARAFYDRNHRSNLLREAIAATARGDFIEPKRPEYYADALQAYLDENGQAFEHWFRRGKRRSSIKKLVRRLRLALSRRGSGEASSVNSAWLEAIDSVGRSVPRLGDDRKFSSEQNSDSGLRVLDDGRTAKHGPASDS